MVILAVFVTVGVCVCQVTNLIKANMVDIVKPEWVQLCIQAKRLLPLEPSYVSQSALVVADGGD